jgi:hypothetical protein
VATALEIVFGILLLGRAIYPTPMQWRLRPWFVKTDRQGRALLAAFGGVWLVIGIASAVG